MWQFPLHLLATSAAPDDAITVEAQGLNKETQGGSGSPAWQSKSRDKHGTILRVYIASKITCSVLLRWSITSFNSDLRHSPHRHPSPSQHTWLLAQTQSSVSTLPAGNWHPSTPGAPSSALHIDPQHMAGTTMRGLLCRYV